MSGHNILHQVEDDKSMPEGVTIGSIAILGVMIVGVGSDNVVYVSYNGAWKPFTTKFLTSMPEEAPAEEAVESTETSETSADEAQVEETSEEATAPAEGSEDKAEEAAE